MIFSKSKLFLVALMSCNLANSAFEMTPGRIQALIGTATASGIVGIIAMNQYINSTYLIQEDHLVKSKYPHAQAWYESMFLKYPAAHLDTKLFLQRGRYLPSEYTPYCSSFNQIYFPENALKDINNLYKKSLDGYQLTDEEILILSMQEFILLHEAGHIEHNDMTKRLLSLVGLFAALEAAKCMFVEKTNLTGYNELNQAELVQVITFYTLLIASIRWQESDADAFAYKLSDLDALQGGIKFFEDDKIDPLFNIANKQRSPFISVDSTFGKMHQFFAACTDIPSFYIDKTIKRMFACTDITRWYYDLCHGLTHPGPSTRAYAIRAEIARRLQATA